MSNSSLGTPQQLRDPNYTPPLGQAIPLGIQHVLAMFASNVTPAIIVAGAAGFGFGSNSPDFGNMIYMIQMAMLFAGVATLIQTIGMGPIGARLPIVQGTSFAFLPIMIPAVLGAGVAGMAGLMTGVLVGGLFHMVLGLFIGRIRFALPPLVTGLIVLMIGLALVKVGIQYAAGGVPAMGALNKAMAAKADISGMEFGSLWNWSIALVVIIVTLAIKFFSKGFLSVAAILIGLVAGYIYAYVFGDAHFARAFGNVGNAAWFAAPSPFKFGFAWDWAIIIGMCLMAFISAIETVGDTSGITKGGAGREATDTEITGATYADGLGTAIAGIFGSLPNTSFSQNVGLISMTGIMSRGVVTIGAIFLIICGLIPKVGAVISTVPIEVLGGGVIVMFGMVAAAGINMLSDVNWNRRNMLIFATAISIGLGLQLVPNALAHMNGTWKILLTSGLLPAAFIAILLNLLLPEDESDDDHMTAMAGLDSTSDHSHGGAGAQAGAGARGVAHAVENAASHAGQSTSASALISGGGTAVAGGAAALASAGSSAKSAASGAGSSAASAAGSAAKTVKAKAKTAKKSASATVKKAAPKKAAAKAPAKKATAKAAPAKKAAAKKAPAAKKASSAKGKLAGSAIDDLEFVDGIGPKTAKSLQSAGVKNLSGLVKMSDANLEKAAQKAGTGGRPESENWKKQATDILGGKAPQAKSDRAAWERAMKKM